MWDRDRHQAAAVIGHAGGADHPGRAAGHLQQDAAGLTALQDADMQALRAAEMALLASGLDPADPWAMQDHDMGVDGFDPPALQPPARIHGAGAEFDPEVRGTDYVYLRLADHLSARIEAGELVRGTRLPGERDFAMQYGVSVGTVRRVAAELRNRGLIVTLPAKGTYVL